MKIAIVGSRDFKDKKFVFDKLNELFKGNYTHEKVNPIVISGGAKGVDTWAREWICNRTGRYSYLYYEEITPVNPGNKLDYLFRNVEIITMADKIIAFWDGKSKGTKFVIDYAKARNKSIEIIKNEKEKEKRGCNEN